RNAEFLRMGGQSDWKGAYSDRARHGSADRAQAAGACRCGRHADGGSGEEGIGKMTFRVELLKRVVAACAIASSLVFLMAGRSCAQDLFVQNPGGKPEVLKNVGLDQRLNAQVPMDLTFKDERGTSITLGQLVNGKPAILTMVYYKCPMLCTEVLNGTLNSLKEVPL